MQLWVAWKKDKYVSWKKLYNWSLQLWSEPLQFWFWGKKNAPCKCQSTRNILFYFWKFATNQKANKHLKASLAPRAVKPQGWEHFDTPPLLHKAYTVRLEDILLETTVWSTLAFAACFYGNQNDFYLVDRDFVTQSTPPTHISHPSSQFLFFYLLLVAA